MTTITRIAFGQRETVIWRRPLRARPFLVILGWLGGRWLVREE